MVPQWNPFTCSAAGPLLVEGGRSRQSFGGHTGGQQAQTHNQCRKHREGDQCAGGQLEELIPCMQQLKAMGGRRGESGLQLLQTKPYRGLDPIIASPCKT